MNTVNIDETLELDSEVESLGKVEKMIDSQQQLLNIDDGIYGKYMLSVIEAVNNAIVHGNKLDPEKKVGIRFHIDNKRIEFTVQDQGDGFDPDALPDPTLEENLEKECGRGIFLIKNLCDEVRFEDNGRRVTMIFNLQ